MFINLKMSLIILTFFIGGCGIFFLGLNDWSKGHQLKSRGKVATVLRVVNLPGNADEVRFIMEDGKVQMELMVVPPSVRSRLLRREEVTIDYLPEDPAVNRWTGGKNAGGVLVLMGLVTLGVAVQFYKWMMR